MMDPIPCHFYEDGQRKNGTLQLEENHLVFQTGRFKDKTKVPYQMIKAAQQDDQQRLISQIDIITKSFKKFTLDVSPGPLGTILTRVNGRSKAASLRELPAFKTNERVSVEEWDEFTLATEYAMMKVPNNEWKITDLNKNFELCSTYPKVLAVPTTATDFIIKGSAKFRSRQRLPILTYLHGNGGSIVRCAQPMAGANNRSEMDEKLLELCVDTSRSRSNGLIVDTRPMINAMANRAQGKGYENVEHYQKCSFEFHGIENIHVMRKSLESLEQKGWLSSDWLKHIYAVLDSVEKTQISRGRGGRGGQK
ncbi:unnamed protein product [Oikopleura dioica]|uniref:Myotubularin phosphatase domain-containing protein n=1 Tax=Oikopleura dioica TaxID=34765 RepID=E4X313_OIKDI|nr:unnamed protein product [Oikopleura dioica]